MRCPSILLPAEEIVYRMKQPDSGVVVYVDPLNSSIGPFEAIPVDVYVFADTWGIYVDELEINITGLPQYTLGICIQVLESPISLSIDRRKFIENSDYQVRKGARTFRFWVTTFFSTPVQIRRRSNRYSSAD